MSFLSWLKKPENNEQLPLVGGSWILHDVTYHVLSVIQRSHINDEISSEPTTTLLLHDTRASEELGVPLDPEIVTTIAHVGTNGILTTVGPWITREEWWEQEKRIRMSERSFLGHGIEKEL